jgi:IS5 family transposase
MVAADAGFYSLKNEKTIQGMGVARVAVPSRNSKSSERRKLQKMRWFRAGHPAKSVIQSATELASV